MTEFRLALRSLRNRPLFAVVAILTLALGIGATTTLFTIVNAVLLRPLPYPEAARIVTISEAEDGKDGQVATVPDYYAWRHAPAFASLSMYGGTSRVVRVGGSPSRVSGQAVSASFFSVFQARPAMGRVFRADEDVDGGPDVVVLSDDLWRQLGADSSIVGRTVQLDDRPVTVLGVMAPGFSAPRTAKFWVPVQMDSVADNGSVFYTAIVGRLKPGVSMSAARAQVATILSHRPAPAFGSQGPLGARPTAVLMTLHDRMFGETRPALVMLFGAVSFLLLIACANVANLLLARGAARQREFAVRVALGASRWRLARNLLWESLVVSVIGGTLGLLIPLWSTGFFVRISPASVARVGDIHVDLTVLAFAALLSVITGVVFGLVPAFAATSTNTLQGLKEGGQRASGTTVQKRIRQVLVVTELTTALVLLTGAALLSESFVRSLAVPLGFRPDHTLEVEAYTTKRAFSTDSSTIAFFERLAAQIRALPGVVSVGYADAPALDGYHMTLRTLNPGTHKLSPMMAVMRGSGEYMTTLGMTATAGRLFTNADRAGAPPVAILSKAAADILFPGKSPLGETISVLPDTPPTTVVGIVNDSYEPGSEVPRLPQIYLPIAQAPDSPYLLVARYSGDGTALTAGVRRITAGFDPLQVDVSVGSLSEDVDRIVAPRRFNSVVIDVFAGLALVLAAVGLYGVMAYQVAQRTRELGIRMALGADRARVLRYVLRDGMGLAVLGTVCGVALALPMSRLVAGMLFGVAPRDPSTFLGVSAVLLAVAALACYIPALRATRVDPMVALRYE